MRRKLAYLILSLSLIFGAAATFGTTLTKIDTDVTYGSGKDMYFRISDEASKEFNPYNGVNPGGYITSEKGYAAVDAVATEMENRLKTWGANASVTKEGYDTIKVSIRSQEADATEYNYLENYLAFSGGDITITAGTSVQSIQEEADKTYLGDKYINNAMFKDQTASISYVKNVPVVTIPVNYTGKEGALGQLITFCGNNTKEANSSTGTEAQNCYIVLWANRQEGDSYAAAYSSSSADYDANVAKRIIFGEASANAWYDATNDDDDYKTFQMIPNSEALTENGYDSKKAGAAYKAAFYYMNMLNASSYKTLMGTGSGALSLFVSYAYSVTAEATVESLITAGDWHMTPAFNASLIASIVALAVGIIVLAVYYRMGVFGILSNVAVALMGALLFFAYFHAQFGVGALLGLVLVALVTAFGGIYYFAKVKEGLYQGKSIKKASSDAIRKSLWPTIDGGIVSIVLGLCVYGLISGAVGKLGLILVFGGFFGSVSNILLLRLEGWLLANDNDVELHLDRIYGVDPSKVPNLLKEDKQTYFGPYADKNFQKPALGIGIGAAVLAVASIAAIAAFSVTTGSAYNYADTYADTTSIAIEYRVNKGTSATLLLSDKSSLENNFFPYVSIDGTSLSKLYGNIDTTTGEIYDSSDEKTYTVYYFNVALNQHYEMTGKTYTFVYSFSSSPETQTNSFNDGLSYAGSVYGGEALTVEGQNVVVEAGTPSLASVYIALSIALASLLVYFALRFKPARALAQTLVAGVSGLLVAGFFTLTRIPVTPLVSMGILATTFLAYLIAIFLFGKEHEISKESREKDKLSLSFQLDCLKKANGESAGDLVVYSLLAAGVFIAYWGFVPSVWSYVFLGSFLGFVFAMVLTLVLIQPLVSWIENLLSKVHLNFHPFKKDGGASGQIKKKSSEPEEAVFIGIND
jgi:hypothetical protein